MEFLGDRVLGLIIAKKLLEIYPDEKEGVLDKKFASLVNKKTCLQIGKNINLEKYILTFNPKNKKVTGPYERFRLMIYGQQYKFLLNHSSHKINLITNTSNIFIYKIEILSDKKQLFFYEWHVQKGSDEKCKNCWFTSAVSIPVDQGNTI